MNPPGHSSIDTLHTVTLYIYIHIIYIKEINPPVNQT